MLGLVGTIPEKSFPLLAGPAIYQNGQIAVDGKTVDVNRGTPALIAAAMETLKYLGRPEPTVFLVGDIGSGEGCHSMYQFLTERLADHSLNTLALHYFQPDVGRFKKLLATIDALESRPVLIADAGFMYVAKMGSEASSFDLFTPDAGELAYLADEEAPHPFYTRGFILHEENLAPDLIKRAYEHNNAASYLLVKGATDYIADKSGVLATVSEPQEEALEAIGGTGDTLTGIVSALIEAGLDLKTALIKAARTNRLAGALASPTPATQVYDIIRQIPFALEQVLKEEERASG